MRVLAFTSGGNQQPSAHYRAYLLGRYLQEADPGFVWDIAQPSTKDLSAAPFFHQIRISCKLAWKLFFGGYDLIFIQRAIYNKFVFLALLAQNMFGRIPSIFDIDDSVFLHSPTKTRLLARTSDACIGGSGYLCKYLSRYNIRTALIPTVIKMSDYVPAKLRKYGVDIPTIGWIGNGPAYLPELREFIPILFELYKEGIRFRLLFIGIMGNEELRHLFAGFDPADCELVDYVEATTDADFMPYFMRMDIGIMPIAHDEWSRGKCSLKAIQYMASGMATIASRWGENEVVIVDGVSGLLASTPEEWKDALRRFITDSRVREQFGKAARARVAAQYSYESQLPVYRKLLTQTKNR